MLKVVGCILTMAIVAGTMHFFGLGNQVVVQEINGKPTNVLVKSFE